MVLLLSISSAISFIYLYYTFSFRTSRLKGPKGAQGEGRKGRESVTCAVPFYAFISISFITVFSNHNITAVTNIRMDKKKRYK